MIVSTTLQTTTYPFVAIITLQRPGGSLSATPKMTVVDRIEGLNDAATIIRRLGNAKERYGPALERMRREREERDMERSLRDEQDRAYQESLKADQEKVNSYYINFLRCMCTYSIIGTHSSTCSRRSCSR
jgi:FAS-associated factor 2